MYAVNLQLLHSKIRFENRTKNRVSEKLFENSIPKRVLEVVILK